MRIINKTSALLATAMLVGAFVGCGEKKPDSLPPLQPTTLTFTVDGKGLAKGRKRLYGIHFLKNESVILLIVFQQLIKIVIFTIIHFFTLFA